MARGTAKPGQSCGSKASARRRSGCIDHPFLFFGDVVAPGAASAAAAPAGAGAPGDRQFVYLQMTLPGRGSLAANTVKPLSKNPGAIQNLPEAVITQVADDVQFSSDVVNIWGRDYGDSRVSGGDTAFDLESVAQTFYEHFADDYDVLAVVSQHTEFTDGFGFHRVVRNPVTGLGLPIADDSAAYGSNGVLQAVEGYPPGGFASNRTMLHETAHQWSEYSGVWDAVTLPAPGARSALDRRGHDPEAHTPLLYPGEVLGRCGARGHPPGCGTGRRVHDRADDPHGGLQPIDLVSDGSDGAR